MHHDYADIRALTDQPPIWFDEYAVPRYAPFAPGIQANIYADEVILMEIACQNCKTRFQIAMSSSNFDRIARGWQPLADRVAKQEIHYGDPPNTECCPAGPTMNCLDLKVLEFWGRNEDDRFEWVRRPELEIEIEDINDYL